jgi:hypothetical protein
LPPQRCCCAGATPDPCPSSTDLTTRSARGAARAHDPRSNRHAKDPPRPS